MEPNKQSSFPSGDNSQTPTSNTQAQSPSTPPVTTTAMSGQQATPTPPPAVPASSAPPTTPVQPHVTTQSHSKAMLVVAFTVVVVAVLAFVLWYTMGQSSTATLPTTNTANQATGAASLEDEVNAMNVEENDSDFMQVDKDLQSL